MYASQWALSKPTGAMKVIYIIGPIPRSANGGDGRLKEGCGGRKRIHSWRRRAVTVDVTSAERINAA